MLDILIRNGDVVDGTGAPRHRADVALRGGLIVEIGMLEGARASRVIDATGCVVAPGFIDIHSHADFTLPILPTADSLVRQGVTSVVCGQCGAGMAPLLGSARETYTREAIRVLERYAWPGNFRELEAVLERALLLHRRGPELGAGEIAAALGG